MFRLAHSTLASATRYGLASGSVRMIAATPRLAAATHSAIYRHMSTQKRDVRGAIDQAVKTHPLVVFMKGVPEAPQCGFSNAVVQILDMHGVKEYLSFNVLEDDELRQTIKEYSNWPTVPQVYVKGEFVGGCDIMIDLHKSGELVDILKDAGIKSTMTYEEDDKDSKQ